MQLPFFYSDALSTGERQLILNEENSRHIVQVLRMQAGELLRLTDGLGKVCTARIMDPHKKKCSVEITATSITDPKWKRVSIAISPLKNNSRFEWFLEKATEIGVTEIIPILCTRTEKQHFRYDRMRGILISAMLQSQQAWLPALHEPRKFTDYINSQKDKEGRKLIAHCISGNKSLLKAQSDLGDVSILIGPEGDFTPDEIEIALQNDFTAVSLGNTRLRTETAGLAAAILLSIG